LLLLYFAPGEKSHQQRHQPINGVTEEQDHGADYNLSQAQAANFSLAAPRIKILPLTVVRQAFRPHLAYSETASSRKH
jgi:hypothetical protein